LIGVERLERLSSADLLSGQVPQVPKEEGNGDFEKEAESNPSEPVNRFPLG